MNRTRASSLDAFGLRDQRNRIYPALEASDGSTLSLDFTQMSSLDSRFTFDRSPLTTSGAVGTATFINSSGQVQIADHNLVANSTLGSSATPSGWSGSTGVNLTTPAVGVRRAVTTTAAQNWIQTSNLATSTGLTYSSSVYINEVSGQHYANTLAVTASPSNATYYRNGVAVGQYDTAQPGLITMTWTASTGSGHSMRVGVGSTGVGIASAVCEFTAPRTSRGTYTQPTYIPNSSTAGGYYAPRFHYSPVTLAPLGLLIEGAATNIALQSNGATSSWTGGANRTPTNNTTDLVSPDGTNNATQLVCGTSGQYGSYFQTISGLTGGATYTVSYWIRGPVGHVPRLYAVNGTVGDVTATSTTGTYSNTGWTRLTQTYTLPASTTQVYVYFLSVSISTSGETYYVYGFQLEAGNGASSYIPTGTSTVQRAADQCFIADASPFQVSTTNGTLYWSGIIHKQTPSSYTEIVGFMNASVPTFEVWTNGLNIGVAARGTSLSAGGDNEVTRAYTLNAQTRYACSVNTTSDPIVVAILNGGTVGTKDKSGTGDMFASTRFVLGRQPTSTYGSFMPCMTFAQVKYWPVTKTQAELNLLTTT